MEGNIYPYLDGRAVRSLHSSRPDFSEKSLATNMSQELLVVNEDREGQTRLPAPVL